MSERTVGTVRSVPGFTTRIERERHGPRYEVLVWETCRGPASRLTNYRGALAATTSIEAAEAAERLLTSVEAWRERGQKGHKP